MTPPENAVFNKLSVETGEYAAVSDPLGSRGSECLLQFANPLFSILKCAHLFVRERGERFPAHHFNLLVENVE